MVIIESLSENGNRLNDPNRIIVHAMAENIMSDGTTYTSIDWLNEIGLSAHALCTPNGEIIRCRKDDQGAWHAKGHNENTLGIEFLVPGVHGYGSFIETIKRPYLTDKQHRAGTEFVKNWMDLWDITEIQRHSDIDPNRKKDPGKGFPWVQFLEDLGVVF